MKKKLFTQKASDNKLHQTALSAIFSLFEGTSSPLKRVPFPCPKQWGEVVSNNIQVIAMPSPSYCRKLTLFWQEPGQFICQKAQKKLFCVVSLSLKLFSLTTKGTAQGMIRKTFFNDCNQWRWKLPFSIMGPSPSCCDLCSFKFLQSAYTVTPQSHINQHTNHSTT